MWWNRGVFDGGSFQYIGNKPNLTYCGTCTKGTRNEQLQQTDVANQGVRCGSTDDKDDNETSVTNIISRALKATQDWSRYREVWKDRACVVESTRRKIIASGYSKTYEIEE